MIIRFAFRGVQAGSELQNKDTSCIVCSQGRFLTTNHPSSRVGFEMRFSNHIESLNPEEGEVFSFESDFSRILVRFT